MRNREFKETPYPLLPLVTGIVSVPFRYTGKTLNVSLWIRLSLKRGLDKS